MIRATLCFVFEGNPRNKVLLGYKKRGFGQGKVDGFGGKLQAGESMEEAAARELFEETGLTVSPSDLAPMGVLSFVFPEKPVWNQEVHIFIAQNWAGSPVESEEMRPHWFTFDDIPYDQMWDDSYYWLPYILAEKPITAVFNYSPDNETVKDYSLEEL